MRTIVTASVLSALLMIAGCASAPTQEMSDARQALGAARDARAKVFAPRLLGEAERALGKAVTALRAHDFETARARARAARQQALSARRLATALAAARAGLRTAGARGIAVAPVRRLLSAADAALQRDDVKRAVALAEQAARAVRGGQTE